MRKSGSKKSNVKIFEYGGRKFRYTKIEGKGGLAEKLKMTNIKRVKSLVERKSDSGRRIIYNAKNNEIFPVNIFKENVSGILRKKFNIGRVLKTNILTTENRSVINKNKEIELFKKIDAEEEIKVIISCTFYSKPYSTPDDNDIEQMQEVDTLIIEDKMNDIINNGKKYVEKEFNDYLNYFEERYFTINYEGSGDELYNDLYRNLDTNINVFLYKNDENFPDQDVRNGYYGQILRKAYMNTYGWSKLMFVKVDILSTYKNRKLKLSRDGKISESRIYQLEEWANIKYNNEGDDEDSCAVKFISDKFPHLYWEFKKEESKGEKGNRYMRTDKFLELCDEHDINYEVYNVNGGLEKKHTHNKMNIGIIRCIIYQNHIYPITGGKLRKKRNTNYKIKYVNNNNPFLEKINSLQIPGRIIISPISADTSKEALNKLNNINVVSFTSGEKRYINNPEYVTCYKFLERLNLLDMIKDDIKITSLINILEKSEKVPDAKSFIPENYLFTKRPLLWKTDEKIDKERVIVKDKNKAYACALYNLPYLIKFDFRKNSIRKFNDKTKIVDEFLYYVRVSEWTTAIPEDNLYSGYHLKECIKYGVDFDIIEELETTVLPNYYRKLIDITRKYLDESTFKNMWVKHIGCMESGISSSHECKFKAIYTNDQKDFYSGYRVKFGDSHTMSFDVKETFKNVRNKFPIASQIKDMSRMTIIREINKMGLKDEDLVQLKTDAIAYYGKISNDLDPSNFFGWKNEKFEEMAYKNPKNKTYDSFLKEIGEIPAEGIKNLGVLDLCIDDDDKRVRKLHMQYAGSGKTTYIIKKLIPNLLKSGYEKEDIIVLTPTHYTLSEYKREGINCEIIQKYTFDNTIAKEKYVIVDEIGCIETTCHDMIYKLVKSGKNIECFGDFNQLQPIGEDKKLNQEHYLKYLFKEINTKFTNYRNKFTKEYYDSLIHKKVDISNKEDINRADLVYEINRWKSKKWNETDYIICYRHKTKNMYNNMMLKYNGKKSWMSIGVKIVCKNNKLKDLDIWNKKEFVIKKIIKGDDKKFVLEDKYKLDKDVIVTEKQLKSNFEMAYACNVHQIQGATLNSYYWAPEDDRFVNGNVAYTIISRLRQKI